MLPVKYARMTDGATAVRHRHNRPYQKVTLLRFAAQTSVLQPKRAQEQP
jgi:hypothetical protein